MIRLKTEAEIKIMHRGGLILKEVLELLCREAKEGTRLIDLDQIAAEEIQKRGGGSSFKRVPNYHWTTCLCVNDVVVHGIPGNYRLQKGDILGIDAGVYYQGFHNDSAWSILIGDPDLSLPVNKIKKEFLRAGEEALSGALDQVKAGNRIGDISRAIQEVIEGKGYSVVHSLVGHGVGKDLHEDPEIPGYTKRPIEKTPLIHRGMVLAVEVIYNLGSHEVVYSTNDGWTIATVDGRISGLFEKTIAVTSHGSLLLT